MFQSHRSCTTQHKQTQRDTQTLRPSMYLRKPFETDPIELVLAQPSSLELDDQTATALLFGLVLFGALSCLHTEIYIFRVTFLCSIVAISQTTQNYANGMDFALELLENETTTTSSRTQTVVSAHRNEHLPETRTSTVVAAQSSRATSSKLAPKAPKSQFSVTPITSIGNSKSLDLQSRSQI